MKANPDAGREIWKQVLLICAACALIAILIAIVKAVVVKPWKQHFHPQWVEHYSVSGNALKIVNETGSPISGVLVVRLAIMAAMSGGLDVHDVNIPKPGERPWAEIQSGAQWDVTASYSDSNGGVVVAPFDAKCEGHRTNFGCAQNHGYFALVVYKRGYGTQVVVPTVDQPTPALLRLALIGHTHTDEFVGYEDWYRYQSIEHLILPPLPGAASRLQDPGYYTHALPDGKTILQLAEEETVWLKSQQRTKRAQDHASQLLDAIKTGHPETLGPVGP